MEFFIKKLRELNLFLVEKEGKLVLKGLKGKLTAEETEKVKKNKEIIEFISSNKPALIEHLRNETKKQVFYKLSPLQEGLLFHGLYDPESTSYTIQFGFDFNKKIAVDVLKKSWEYIVNKHTILRTAFFYEEITLPVQRVYETIELPFKEIDLSTLTSVEKEERVQQFMKEDYHAGFAFNKAPLFRITLLKLDETSYKMVFSNHHIIMDGWSLPVLMNELLYTYNVYHMGREPEDVVEDNYEDYIKYIASKDPKVEENFWRTYMKGTESPTLLPFYKTETSGNKVTGECEETSLEYNEQTTQKLVDFAKRYRLTTNTVLQGVWAYLLYRYTGDADVKFGVTVSGRPAEIGNAEQRVGLYINTLPFRTVVENQTIISWLEKIQKDHTSCREYQYINLAKIQSFTSAKEDLFDTLFVFENFPITDTTEGEDNYLTIDSLDGKEQTNYPITISVVLNEVLDVKFSYNKNLLNEEVIKMIQGHFRIVLEQVLTAPERELATIKMLTPIEENKILHTFNDTAVSIPPHETILDLFKRQVARTPNNIAVVFENQELTYQELDEKSSQLANYINSIDLVGNHYIGICISRSIEMIVGVLGILKSGNAYIPIDPSYPAERIEYMLEDSGVSVVISSSADVHLLTLKEGGGTVLLDEDAPKIKAFPTELSVSKVTPETTAYVIYTSGTTGKPKGVEVGHASLYNISLSWEKDFELDTETRLLQMASFSFDAFSGDVCRSLLFGGQMIICSNDIRFDLEGLYALISERKANIIELTPSLGVPLMDYIYENQLDFSWVKILNLGSDTCSSIDFQRIQKRFGNQFRIINSYGVTEVTVDSSYYEEKDVAYLNNLTNVPIGKPMFNTQFYVVDAQLNLVPIGVAGELCIGGFGLAKGYLNRPELTREKFVVNPYVPNQLMYRTGDLARWLPDGNVDFIGRGDDQVKIRGYRIELGEIENTLIQLDEVMSCCVLAKQDSTGSKRLVGYVVTKTEFNKTRLEDHLKSAMPEYMVPAIWVSLKEMPLTSNGKLDKRSLPNPDVSELLENEYVAPRNKTEEAVCKIWEKLLEVSKVGVTDNFFTLGGHSLLVVRLVSMIRRSFEVEIAIKDIFTSPTIEEQCQFILKAPQNLMIPIPTPQEKGEFIPLSFSQERLWFLDKLQGSREYHMPVIFRLEGVINSDTLEKAFRAIVKKHDVFRTTIHSNGGIGYQTFINSESWMMVQQSVENESQLKKAMESFLNTPFNLATDYMIRTCLYKLEDKNQYVLAIIMHHIASDGWSDSILFDELVKNYNVLNSGKQIEEEAMSFRYADYAIWQRKFLSGNILEQQLGYWTEHLKEVPALALPTDYPRPAKQTVTGSSITYELNKTLSNQIAEIGKNNGATTFMTLLTAFKVLLYKYSGQHDICVGTPIANRPYQELEDLIGFFVNTLALRTTVHSEISFVENLKKVKEVTLGAYQHQMVPFEKVVDSVITTRDMSMSPLFQVMFVLQNTPDIEDVTMNDVKLLPYEYTAETSTYDITLTAIETEEGISMNVVYNTSLFKKNTIELMMLHFENLLKSITANPEESVAHLNILTNAEKGQLLVDFNNTKVAYNLEQSVIDVFKKQVSENPENIALISEENTLTYAQLDQESDRLANYLLKIGVANEAKVAIIMDRTQDMVISILAILKAGGTFVPIAPEYPQDRINYIIEDADISVIISKSTLVASSKNETTVILLDLMAENIEKEPLLLVNTQKATASSMAYVLYTSGSTGKPKGVMVTHKNLVNLILGAIDKLNFQSQSTLLSITTYTFDIFYFELFGPLFSGGKAVLVNKEVSTNGKELNDAIKKYNAQFLQATPSNWKMLLASGFEYQENLTLVTSGEAITKELKDKLVPLCSSLWNLYGPTEATIWTTIERLTLDEEITIGVPLPNYSLYIVDANTNLVPVGVVGELCVAGAGVAKGYLNKKELTDKSFIKNPFTATEEQLYFTGDLAKWLPDGRVEYIGRKDSQVKVRGYRIELGEIESQLVALDVVKEGCVITQKDYYGTNRLIGYVVSEKEKLENEEIINELKKKLPEYMVPAIWVMLDELPKNSSGKLDRKALPNPDFSQNSKETFIAPRTETELELATIWKELLKVEKVGVHDNFFELGGHSVLAVQLIAKINHTFSMDLSLGSLFEFPTIAELAKKRFSGIEIKDEILVTLNDKGSKKPIFCAPPGGGTVLCYRPLAMALGDDQPFYAFQSPGMDGKTQILETVEEMAEVYISKMQEIDPIGPYKLGGYSFGGEVALEMAIQLQQKGYRVEEILMFDATPPEEKKAIISFEELIAGISTFINKEFSTYKVLTLEDLKGKTKKKQLNLLFSIAQEANIGLTREQMEVYVEVHKNNINCSYVPKLEEKLDTTIHLFKAQEMIQEEMSLENTTSKNQEILNKEDYGWSDFVSKDVLVYIIQGDHLTLLEPENVSLIANYIKEGSVKEENEITLIS